MLTLEEIKEQVKEKFGLESQPYDANMLLINATVQELRNLMEFLKEQGFSYAHTVSVVDYTPKGKGFQVNYIIENVDSKKFAMVRVELDSENPTVPSLHDIFPALLPHEREAWEMFGVNFSGHPRLEPMLLPEWAKGLFPLRKSYTFKKHGKEKK
jgi:NADH-quinone oxidoreductase subunit C